MAIIKRNKIILVALITVLVFVIYVFFLERSLVGGIANVSDTFTFKGWFYFLLFTFIHYLLRCLRWCVIIPPSEQGYLKHVLIYIAGFSLTLSPARAGEAVRSYFLKKYNVPYAKSLTALFIDRFFDLLSVLSILLFLSFSKVFMSNHESTYNFIFFAFCVLGLFLLVMAFLSRKIGITIMSLRQTTFVYVISILIWLSQALAFSFLYQDVTSSNDFQFAIQIFLFSLIVGALSFIPGGVGAMETSIVIFLVNSGIGINNATVLSLIGRGVPLAIAIVLGVFCLMFLLKSKNSN